MKHSFLVKQGSIVGKGLFWAYSASDLALATNLSSGPCPPACLPASFQCFLLLSSLLFTSRQGLFFYHTRKVGLGIGVKWGAGVLFTHLVDEHGRAGWSAPVLYTVKEAAVGLIAGASRLSTSKLGSCFVLERQDICATLSSLRLLTCSLALCQINYPLSKCPLLQRGVETCVICLPDPVTAQAREAFRRCWCSAALRRSISSSE